MTFDFGRFRLATFQIKFHLNSKSRDHKFTNITLNIRIVQFSDSHTFISELQRNFQKSHTARPFSAGWRLSVIGDYKSREKSLEDDTILVS